MESETFGGKPYPRPYAHTPPPIRPYLILLSPLLPAPPPPLETGGPGVLPRKILKFYIAVQQF